nr:DUF86 domain-containing protein [Indiicoccus explosivorum]
MYFVDRKKIGSVLSYMEELLDLYGKKEKWEGPVEELALERLAHNVIECIIDIGNAMIDGFIMRDPGSYEDILDILLDERVITEEMHGPLIRVIKIRALLVREFASADHEVITWTLSDAFESLNQFSPAVRTYLTDELGPVSAFSPEQSE